jgi:predicted Zn-dependent protease
MTTELDLAAQVLDLVRHSGLPAEAEVSVERVTHGLTRFANSFIHQHVGEDTTTIQLELHVDGRTATAATTVTSADGLQSLVERAVTAVRVAPPDPGWPGLAPASNAQGQARFDPATAAATGQERAARVRAFVDAAGSPAAGYCETRVYRTAFANSAGQSATGETTSAVMDGVAHHQGSDGVARRASYRLDDLDGAWLGAQAAVKAHAASDPVELPPGRYEVVLEPTAVTDLLTNFAIWGFNGQLYAQGSSFAEPGSPQFDPAVTLVDDPFADGVPGLAFDTEGTPKRRLVLVEAGVTRAVAHDRRTAKMAGGDTESTGHALPLSSRGRFGGIPLHLGLQPAAASTSPANAGQVGVAHPAAAELVASVERGLLVTDLWYTRVLDPKSLVLTGLTRNGVWLIENGTITAPVMNLRFTQSYPQALAPGAVKEVGSTAVALPGPAGGTVWRAPALHLASWNFTGGASG